MSKLNKIVTNYPVTLTPEEVANLSETLSGVRTAGGGGTGGKTYIAGDSYINVDNTHDQIKLTEKATGLLERDIPSAVSQLSDSASYAKVEALSNYQPVGDYLSANALDNLSGTWETVTDKLDKTEFAEVSGAFLTQDSLAGYATEQYVKAASAEVTGWVNTQNYLKTVPDTYYLKTETSGKDEISNAFSNIPAYILTGDSNITATSAQDGKDIKWNLSINAHPTVTDTTLTGERGIYTHTTNVSGQWCVELVQSAYDAINDVVNKLNSSDFTTYTGTTAPALYQTLAGMNDYYKKTETSGKDDISAALNLKADKTDIPSIAGLASETYVQQASAYAYAAATAQIPTTVAELTDSGDYAKKTDIPTVPTKVTDLTDSADYQTVAGMADYLLTATYAADSGKFVTSGSEISAANEQYALTTTGWTKIETPATFTGVTTTGSVSGGGVNNDKIGLTTTAENALTAVGNKVDKPDTTQESLNNKYLVYSTLSGTGAVTGWTDFNTNVYSKTESDGRYVATAEVGTGLYYSGSSPKLGVKLGTDLAFDTNGNIQVNVGGNNNVDSSHYAFIMGVDHTASGQGAFAGGYGTHTSGVGNFIHGTYLSFDCGANYDQVSNTPVFVGGTLNATTAQNYNINGGYLQIIGNGTYTGGGQGNRSDAYILYRDGTVKAKTFIAGGDTLSANYPVPKSVPNTADNTMQVQKMFVCTSDADIVAHAALANGEGCIFFRVG